LPGFIPLTAPQEVELSEEEIGTIVNFLAANPEAGDVIAGIESFAGPVAARAKVASIGPSRSIQAR
jgi:hypothetical protein